MLRKVIVFDCEWLDKHGVEPRLEPEDDVKKYIEKELLVNVEKISTDAFGNKVTISYDTSVSEIIRTIAAMVEPYIGKAEIYVIANPGVAFIALSSLRRKYPGAKFIGYEGDVQKLVDKTRELMIFAPLTIRRSEQYQMMKAKCSDVLVSEPDYALWEQAAGCRNILTRPKLIGDARSGIKVLIIHPGLLHKERQIQHVLGWRGEVVDTRVEIVEAIRRELGIKN